MWQHRKRPIELLLGALAICHGAADVAAAQQANHAANSVEIVTRLHEALDSLETSAEVKARQEQLESIKRDIEALQTQAPTHAWLHYFRGRFLALTGRSADASDQLLHFIVSPEGRNDWRAYRTLGNLFVERFPRLAKGHYERAAALKPGDPSILYGLSLCRFQFGETEEALKLAREAVEADGHQTVSYTAHLARMYRAAGQWDEAVREAVRALTLARAAAKDNPGRETPLRVVDTQLELIVDILQARLAMAGQRSSGDYLALARFVRERGELAGRLALFEELRAIEAGIEETSPDVPEELLRAHAELLTKIGRTADAIE